MLNRLGLSALFFGVMLCAGQLSVADEDPPDGLPLARPCYKEGNQCWTETACPPATPNCPASLVNGKCPCR